jgi:hypothetical protein
MPDQRSVMKEYRFLDEKRVAQGLTPEEQARFERLKDLVGPEVGAGSMKPGFDVNAAAAQLRESLLPAGLRNRPPPPPAPAPEPEPVVEEAAPSAALEQLFEAAPFAPIEEAAPPQDSLFDPSSLGTEQPAYDPNQPYDPNAAYPADPNAYPADAAAYDPNAQPYDPNAAYPADPNAAYPADPNAYPADAAAYDPSAQPYDPNAAYPADPNATYPADPNAYPADAAAYDPNAQPYDPNAAYPADPNAAYPADPNAYPADAAAYDPNAQPYDPSAAYPSDPNTAYPADPHAAYAGDPADAGAYDASAAQPGATPNQSWDPDATQPEGFDPDAPPGHATGYEAGAAADALPPAGWDAELPQPEPTAAPELGEYDAAGGGLLAGEDAGLDAPLPETTLPPETPATPLEFGEYDDSAGFDAAPLDAAPPAEAADPALDQDFQATSGGSFGAGADAAAPEWAAAAAPPPWQDAPPLDLGAHQEPSADGAAGFEVAPALEPEVFAPAPGSTSDLFGPIDGELAVEEVALAPEGGAPALDFSQPDFSSGAPDDDLAEPTFTDPAPLPLGGPPPDSLEAVPLDAPPLDLSFDAPAAAPEPTETPVESAEMVEAEAVAFDEIPAEPFPAEPALEEAFAPPAEAAPAEPEPALAELSEPPVATEPAPMLEEEIPVVDGADILEELVEDVPAAPPQSLDFEPLLPPPAFAPPAPAPLAPPPVAPSAFAPPPAVVAPPPPAPPPTVAPFAAAAPLAPPPPPTPEVVPEPPRAVAEPDAGYHVAGTHRVVVHTLEGLVKRGVLEDTDLDGPFLALAAQPGAEAESLATEKVKAIFFMLAPGEKPPPAEGKKVRVTFRDGRQVAGFSPDYRETGVGFFMIPGDTRTNTGRIWVYRSAVRQVAVS